MRKLNILLLGAGNRSSLCEYLLQAGFKYGCQVSLFSLEKEKYVPICKYASIIEGLPWEDPGFEDQLFEAIFRNNIHMIIPLMDAGTIALSKLKSKIITRTNGLVWPVVSSPELCEIFNDKKLSDDWFIQKGIEVPGDTPGIFPKIVKGRTSYGARDQFMVSSQKELHDLSKKVDLSLYIVQNFIKTDRSKEYTVDAYVTRSHKLLGAVSRVRLKITAGEAVQTVTQWCEPLMEGRVPNILSVVGFEGPITLQFIKTSFNNIPIVEINPRLGGSCGCAFKAGANYCEAMIAEYLGETLPSCQNWKEGLMMLKSWTEHFVET